MIRLVDDAYIEHKELHDTAVFCLTETIKAHLERYFEEDYKAEKKEKLYTKVKSTEVSKLFTKKMLNEIESLGINPSIFIYKKLAQFMILLNKQEEETPDIFIEYILYRMMIRHFKLKYNTIPETVVNKKEELRSLLRTYAIEELCIDDIKERNKYVKDHIILLTEFSSLLGVEKPDDDSLAFWDWDFEFFDSFGFVHTIIQMAYGEFAQLGYGLDGTREIFTSVGEKIPEILNEHK